MIELELMNRFNYKPRILYTTPVLEHPPFGGSALRVENSIKALSSISDLYILSQVSPAMQGDDQRLLFYKQYCKKFYLSPAFSWNYGFRRLIKGAINFIPRRILGRPILTFNRTLYKYVLKLASSIQADVIWLGYGNVSYPLLKYIKSFSNLRVVLDTDSVWSRYLLRGLPYVLDEKTRRTIEKSGKEKEKEEKWGTRLADVTTAVSDVDAEYYRGLAKYPQQVHIFSNVVDIEAYQKVSSPSNGLKKPCIYLAGSFGPRSPMEDGTRWVIREVLPYLRQQRLDFHFYIVGKGSDRILADIKDPDITITGAVSSVLPYLSHADVSLVPLRFESGTRFKILEAGACGIPVVSTTLGAEGIRVSHGRDILIADTPEAFASSVLRLINDHSLARNLGNNLRQLVSTNYSICSLVKEGLSILDYLLRFGCEPHCK